MGWYFPENTNVSFYADYNFVCGTAGGSKSASFQELHGLNGGSPSFANPSVLDFRLTADSQLISTGKTIPGFVTDLEGTLRPQGVAWDIGAFEFSGQTERPPPPTGLRILSVQ
jgi:hypothetical protein